MAPVTSRAAATPPPMHGAVRKSGAPWIWIAVGVVVVGLAGLAVVGLLAFRFAQQQAKQMRVPPQVGPAGQQSRRVAPPNSPSPPNKVTDPAVRTDPATASIPDSPATGTIRGQPFTVEAATVSSMTIVLKQGQEFFPDASLTFFLFLKPNEKVDGRTFTYAPEGKTWPRPHIHVARKEDPKGAPRTQIVTENYALRLEFGERQGNKIPGRIFLEMGESLGTRVAGTFEATAK